MRYIKRHKRSKLGIYQSPGPYYRSKEGSTQTPIAQVPLHKQDRLVMFFSFKHVRCVATLPNTCATANVNHMLITANRGSHLEDTKRPC